MICNLINNQWLPVQCVKGDWLYKNSHVNLVTQFQIKSSLYVTGPKKIGLIYTQNLCTDMESHIGQSQMLSVNLC